MIAFAAITVAIEAIRKEVNWFGIPFGLFALFLLIMVAKEIKHVRDNRYNLKRTRMEGHSIDIVFEPVSNKKDEFILRTERTLYKTTDVIKFKDSEGKNKSASKKESKPQAKVQAEIPTQVQAEQQEDVQAEQQVKVQADKIIEQDETEPAYTWDATVIGKQVEKTNRRTIKQYALLTRVQTNKLIAIMHAENEHSIFADDYIEWQADRIQKPFYVRLWIDPAEYEAPEENISPTLVEERDEYEKQGKATIFSPKTAENAAEVLIG